MNYIRHLNAFFSQVKNDSRLSSTHVSLYLAMFNYWNFNRFQNPFSVYRENLMQLSKIGSKSTYHRCVKELHEAKYIFYHPGGSRFQTVRISIIRLCSDEEEDNRYQQVLFPSLPPPGGLPGRPGQTGDTEGGRLPPPVRRTPDFFGGGGLEGGSSCPKNGTDTVPKMVRTSPKNGTDTVPKLGHSININYSKLNSVCNTPTEIFEKNEELNEKPNEVARVPNSVPNPRLKAGNSSFPKGGARRPEDFQGGGNPPLEGVARRAGGVPGDLKEAESFFLQHHSTTEEAQKFFYYNQGKNWMLTDKLPISDWKALARKWMLNSKQSKQQPMDINTTIQAVYQLYLEGERVNKLLMPEFADHLRLQISDAIKQEAVRRRINQLSGTNENSNIQLWKAYMQEEFSSDLVINDEPNLLALAKRLAVAKHFQKLKSKHQPNVFSP